MITFAGLPAHASLSEASPKIVILGAAHGAGYEGEAPLSADPPRVIREQSNRYPDDPYAWDFDLGGVWAEVCGKRVVDSGDLPLSPAGPKENQCLIDHAIKEILSSESIPIVLGGDDSIPIPVIRGFAGQEPFYILQLDAHIDWRDEVRGNREGYSSAMRRASEMPWVQGIVQVGARGVGSAREEEFQAAMDYGAHLVSARQFHQEGVQRTLRRIPRQSRCLLTMDFDVLDPAIMPAVAAPSPGGLNFQETVDLIHAAAQRFSLIGACLVELTPQADLRQLGAMTAMRVAWNLIYALAKNS